jgi:hypothetical protein
MRQTRYVRSIATRREVTASTLVRMKNVNHEPGYGAPVDHQSDAQKNRKFEIGRWEFS